MTPSRTAVTNQKLLRGTGVLCVFAVLGPAIGGLILFSVLAVAFKIFGIAPKPETEGGAALNGFNLLTFSLALGFAFGGIQAVLTGALAGFKTIRTGTVSWLVAAGAACAASLAYAALIFSPLSPIGGSSGMSEGGATITLFLIPIAVLSALVCRGICRWLKLISD